MSSGAMTANQYRVLSLIKLHILCTPLRYSMSPRRYAFCAIWFGCCFRFWANVNMHSVFWFSFILCVRGVRLHIIMTHTRRAHNQALKQQSPIYAKLIKIGMRLLYITREFTFLTVRFVSLFLHFFCIIIFLN